MSQKKPLPKIPRPFARTKRPKHCTRMGVARVRRRLLELAAEMLRTERDLR